MADIGTWLALKSVPGVGNHLYKQLIERFSTPEKVFSAAEAELIAVEGVSPKLARAVRVHRRPDAAVRAEIQRAGDLGCRIITFNDPEYPSLLRHIHDPPPYLYVRGRLATLENGIAVVGARKASSYGMAAARRLARELSEMGWTIVSGMARGIDTSAHKGALDGAGRTVAVMGSGFAEIYPPENRVLFDRICEQGAVISEFPVQEPPNAYNFPARNRIISGMTLGTVVVEASSKSGSLITARLAAEQGREVFAVPGSIHSHTSEGTHNLLKQGAKLVTTVEDIIEEFPRFQGRTIKHGTAAGVETTGSSGVNSGDRPVLRGEDAWSGELPIGSDSDVGGNIVGVSVGRSAGRSADTATRGPAGVSTGLTPDQAGVLEIIDAYPVHIDDLCRRAGMDIGRLSGLLLNLELKGLIYQRPGKYFCLKEEPH